jgi:serine/threonine protein kinase
MGAVYLALRDDDQFKRRVALKIVHRGVETAEVVRRFRQERQILAGLNHESIAQLFDGGVTDDGRPYRRSCAPRRRPCREPAGALQSRLRAMMPISRFRSPETGVPLALLSPSGRAFALPHP